MLCGLTNYDIGCCRPFCSRPLINQKEAHRRGRDRKCLPPAPQGAIKSTALDLGVGRRSVQGKFEWKRSYELLRSDATSR